MPKRRVATAACLILAASGAAAQDGAAGLDPGLVAAGERVWSRCAPCHQIGPGARSRIAAHLNGILGARAAALPDVQYSPPLTAAGQGGLVWTEASLDAYIARPRRFVPGTSMAFGGLREAGDRRAVIAFITANGGRDEHPDRPR